MNVKVNLQEAHAMPLTRLLYFSENTMETGPAALQGLRSILAASNRNNKQNGVTGALVFDREWFLQALEGERAAVWSTLKRLEEDERHAGVVIVEAIAVEERLFANWWMGLATRDVRTAHAFAPHLRNGLLQPQKMTSSDILDLMTSLSRIGLSRSLAQAA